MYHDIMVVSWSVSCLYHGREHYASGQSKNAQKQYNIFADGIAFVCFYDAG